MICQEGAIFCSRKRRMISLPSITFNAVSPIVLAKIKNSYLRIVYMFSLEQHFCESKVTERSMLSRSCKHPREDDLTMARQFPPDTKAEVISEDNGFEAGVESYKLTLKQSARFSDQCSVRSTVEAGKR
jgi:hypothetical protein